MNSKAPASKSGYKVHFTTFLVVIVILLVILFFLVTISGFFGLNILKLFGFKTIIITAPKNISVTPPTNTTNSTIPLPKYTIFYESGLPQNTLWSILLPSGTEYSNVNYLNYSSFLKSFSFSVNKVFSNGCAFSPSPESRQVVAGNSVYISFSAVCNTTFTRYGLPNDLNWTISYGNVSKYINTNSTRFVSTNGDYYFSVSDSFYNGCPYYPYPQSGYVVAGSSKYIIFFTTCSSKSDTVTFLETGLPFGYSWTVKYDNITNSSNSTGIIFSPLNSASLIPIFNVSVINRNNCIFTPSLENGNATIGQTVLITFTSVCNTSVSEEGLPNNTKWNVTFDNKTVYSSYSTLSINTNYTLSNLSLKTIILGNCTFNPAVNNSNQVIAGSSILVRFSASCITSFSEKNLPVGLNWSVDYGNKTLQSTSDIIKFNTSDVFAGFSVPNATEGGCIYSPTTPNGNLTAGSSLSISFSQTCHTVFVSKGLPSGISWSVNYDNQTRDGAFNSSIEFPYYKGRTFSYNVSVIKVGNCVLTPSPKNGTILAGELQTITFSGECTTTFTQTGLPNNTKWNATFDNKIKASTSTGIYFDTVNGSYPFSIASQPISKGCYYVPSPSSGNISAGSNETIGFTDDCTTNFIDPGLPQGANWTVTFAGLTRHSKNQTVSFLLPQGKYYYQVPQTSYNGCNYAPNQTSGSISVGKDVHVTFNLTTCDTAFSEKGLPQGTSWQIIFNGTALDSQTNLISFSSFPGEYSFSVGKIILGTCVFSPNESEGIISAGSSPVISFSSLCYTDFYEKGLASKSTWNVNYDNISNESIGNLIAIKTGYGTFPYSISNVSAGGYCYFIPQPTNGNDTAGTEVTVNYVEKCLSTFHEKGLYKNVQWSVIYNGNTVSTNKNNLSILNLPGNYSYKIPTAFGKGCIFTSLNSSGNLISGKNASVYFNPSSCTSDIIETGLPKNVNWSVSIDNITNYSTEDSILVTTTHGNYSFYIPSVHINGCTFSAGYSDIITAGSVLTVHFSAVCSTSFTETGLPNGTKWQVNDSYPSYFDHNLPTPAEVYSYTSYYSTTNKIIVNSSNSSANPYDVGSIPINTFCSYKPQPSSGSITPGSNLSILFRNNCITSFKETGLPSGTTWRVLFNNINGSSNSNKISFLTQTGSYNFKVFLAESSGCFYSSNITQGTLNSSSVLNIKFTGKFCLTGFNETGLPSNSEWNVTFNNILKATDTSKIIFNSSFSNNSYGYYIKPKSISEQGCHINLTSSSGTVKVGSEINATYINTCKTVFNETGLPNRTNWSMEFDGVISSSLNTSIIMYAFPGNHSYTAQIISVGSGCFYYPKPNSSYLISGGSVAISYTKKCLSTFSESGLPSGAIWSVSYDGLVSSSRLSNISFVTTPGNYSFSIDTINYAYCSFLPSPASGYLNAGGTLNISFIENTCNTTFIETGLPANTQWKLTFDGITENPLTNNVTITTSAGVFTAKFYPINLSNCIFSPQLLASSTAAGGYFTIHFTASCVTTFTENGLPNDTYWFVTYNGTTVSSNSTAINVPSINGTYKYGLPFIGNSSCSYLPNSSSGNAIAGSDIRVSYRGGCTTVFYEDGLPLGSEWNLTYGSQTVNSTGTSIQFVTQPGTFQYNVKNLTLNNCLYVAKNGSSGLIAGSTLYLVFNQTRCYTTFTEDNLPSNTKWVLTYNNINYSSNKTSLELSTAPGTFNFTGYSIKEGGCIFTPTPISGHIAAGSSLLLSFSSSCITLFNETGLAKGITWSVKFDGITNYSSNSSLYLDSIYGNFSFSVPRIQVSANCYLTPSRSGGYLVSGSSIVINFSNYCYSEFTETGLPSGVIWSVKYGNLVNSSVLSDISFNIISGNYSFSIPPVDYHNCYFVSNKSKGYAEAGNYTYIRFTEAYCISNFTESGLPGNTQWSVTFANKSNLSSNQHIYFNITKGLYSFTVLPVEIGGCKYISTPENGSIAAGSDVNITFSVSFCITAFNENGLPLGENWSVAYGSMRNYSTSRNITFNVSTLSSFAFSIQAVNQSQCGFVPVPFSGSATSGSTEKITFNSICHTYFKEEALPAGYTWTVDLGGKNVSSKSSTIELTTVYNDSYTFKIYPSVDYNSGFLSNISTGHITAGSNITVAFSNDTSAYKSPVIIPVSFYNTQTEPTSQPFQQMLVLNASKYSKYENYGLTNIMFAYQNGTVIPSWLESGNSNTSNNTVYWLKIKSIPAGRAITVNMIFNQTLMAYSNNFNTNTTGEAPQLSPTYAEYDDGVNIFTDYWNFAGTTLPSNIINSGIIYTQDNGLNATGTNANGFMYANIDLGDGVGYSFSSYEILYSNTGTITGSGFINLPYDNHAGYNGIGIQGYPNNPDNLYLTNNTEMIHTAGYSQYDGLSVYTTSIVSNSESQSLLNNSNPQTLSYTASGLSNLYPSFIEAPMGAVAYSFLVPMIVKYAFVSITPPNGVMPSAVLNATLITTSFKEVGLPLSYNWSVKYDNISGYSTKSEIYFTTKKGNYSYSVPTLSNSSSNLDCTTTYIPKPSSGYLVTGENGSISYSNSTHCITTFSETGLPINSTFYINYDGINKNTPVSGNELSLIINNSQTIPTPAQFQQMINFSYSNYNPYINLTTGHKFQNVEFFNKTNGKLIDSWLESYTSKYAIFWIKLPNGIPASSSITDVAIGFANKTTNLFNTNTTGEAPQLSPTYAEYDNGKNVFTYYQRWGGLSSLPSGWSSSGVSPVYEPDYMNLWATNGGTAGDIELPSPVSSYPIILESLATWNQPNPGGNDGEFGFFTSAGGTSVLVQTGYYASSSLGYYTSSTGSGLGYTPSTSPLILSFSIPSNSNADFLVNYSSIGSTTSTIDNPYYLEYITTYASSSTSDMFSIYWTRMRAYPPNGVMPAVIINNYTTGISPIFSFSTGPGNFTAKANTSLDCNPQIKIVKAGDRYVFSNWNCTTTFSQSTLPKDSDWWVEYSGINTSNKTGSNIKINSNYSSIGIYDYYAGSNISCSSTGIVDIGTYNNLSKWVCTKEFMEEGLPSDTNWSVKYGNKTNYSNSNLIKITNNFGNYSYDIQNITLLNGIYVPNSSSGYTVSFGKFIVNFSKHSLVTPKSIYSYTVLNITNSQPFATSQSFQQMINFSYSNYNPYINLTTGHKFQNVEFFNKTNGKLIDSWLESYTSKYAIFWIKLPNGIPASSSITDVAIGFANKTTNLFNTNTTGEAPQLSPTYAEYDNGANIFNFYDNFAGTSLGSGWGTSGSPTITVDNGLTLGGSGNSYIGTTSYVTSSPVVYDVDWKETPSSSSLDYGMMVAYTVSSNTGYLMRESGLDGTNTANWFNADNNGFTEIGSASITFPTQTNMHISESLYNSPYGYVGENYTFAQYGSSSTAYNSGGVGFRIGTTGAQVFVQWIRTRAYPPNGVMPTVTLPSINLYLTGVNDSNSSVASNTQSNFTAVASSSSYYVAIYVNGTAVTPFTKGKATYLKTLPAGLYTVTAHSNSSEILNVTYYENVLSSTVSLSTFKDYQAINISNTQSTATPSPFQQMVNITSSYSGWTSISTSNFGQNVEFFYANGTIIPSWLENYTSKDAIWWLKLGSIPASSSITVYMGIASTSSNLFNTVNDGEAPQLSATYGEYDDGVNVFTDYWNFAGTSLPSGWTGSGYTVSNGVTVAGGGGISTNLKLQSSNDFVMDSLTDLYGSGTLYGNIGLSTSTSAGGIGFGPGWNNGGIGFSELGSPNNNGQGPYFSPGPASGKYYIYSEYWLDSTSVPILYSYSNQITGGAYSSDIGTTLSPEITSDNNAYIATKWLRIRAYPPNGVMPTVTLPSINLYLNGIDDSNASILNSSQSNFTAVASSSSYYVAIYVNGTAVTPFTKGKATYLKTLPAGLYTVTAHSNSSEILNVTYYERVTLSTVSLSVFKEYQEINISNTQSTATPSPFQQMINFTSSDSGWTSISTSNFGQNVEFFYANGTVIPSWLESYSSSSAVWWVKVGSIPANSYITIYVGFANKTKNLFNTVDDGEAPQLSAAYGEYDDGVNVFPYYQRWGGLSSLPSGWSNLDSVLVSYASTYTEYEQTSASNYYYGAYGPVPSSVAGNSFTLITYVYSYPNGNTNYFGITSQAPSTSNTNYYTSDISLSQGNNDVNLLVSSSSSSSQIAYLTYVPHSTTDSYDYIYWTGIAAYPPNGIMPSISFGSLQ